MHPVGFHYTDLANYLIKFHSPKLLTVDKSPLVFGFLFCQTNVHPVYAALRRYIEDVG